MKTKVLIAIEEGTIQHISTNYGNMQIVIMHYDKHAEETVSMREYIPDTTFSDKSDEIYFQMDMSGEEEEFVRDFFNSIDF